MLDAAYDESVMSQASVYRSYNETKRSRKSANLMSRPGAPTTVLTKRESTLVQLCNHVL